MTIPNPHDRFFRAVFSRTNIVRDYLTHYLPPAVSRVLDLSELVMQPDSFVDTELEEHQSDVLYLIRLKGGELVYLYLLFEHKSYLDKWVAFQLLQYMIRIWERWRQENPKAQQLIPILPLVLYHGRSQWQIPTDFQSLLPAIPELSAYQLDFRYYLSDFSAYSDSEIKGEVWLRLMLLIWRHIYDEDVESTLLPVMRLGKELMGKESGLEYIATIIRYVSEVAGNLRPEGLERLVMATYPKQGGELMATIEQQWVARHKDEWINEGIEQGIEQGIGQGIEQNLQHNVIDVLDARFGYVPAAMSQRIEQLADTVRLQHLLRQAVATDSLEAFAELLPG